MNREELKTMSEETLEIIKNKKYMTNKGVFNVETNIQNIEYNSNYIFPIYEKKDNKPKYQLLEKTTIGEILSLSKELNSLCVLNFASATNVGGGFIKGSNAQEESLCRSSNLYPYLNNCPNYYISNRQFKSPLYTDYIIYSKDVIGFRNSNYNLCEPFKFNVVSAPAVMNKIAKQKGISEKDVNKVMLLRIEKILKVMILNNQKNIILGAFGSGAFGNNPEMVAKAFRTVLIDDGLEGYFDNIVFAIYDRPDNKTNTIAFKTVFKDFLDNI